MIISASRRTDIPAFYSDWLMQRLRQGYALVRNPFNALQVTRVCLDPQVVDCIVFWTKNPAPLFEKLPEIERLGHRFVVQFTLNGYDRNLEQHVPPLHQRLATFHRLSEQIGSKRVLWRFDPIFLTRSYGPEALVRDFAELAARLRGYTHQCTVSFLSLYAKCRRNLADVDLVSLNDQERMECSRKLVAIAAENGIGLRACCDSFLQQQCGIEAARCIDDRLLAAILGHPLRIPKDKGQRPECGCVASVDIGAYNSCLHGCRYCYANANERSVAANLAAHDPRSPLLIGALTGRETVKDRPAAPLAHALPGSKSVESAVAVSSSTHSVLRRGYL